MFLADELSGTESDSEENSKGQCLLQASPQRTLVYSSLTCISNQLSSLLKPIEAVYILFP